MTMTPVLQRSGWTRVSFENIVLLEEVLFRGNRSSMVIIPYGLTRIALPS